MSNKLDGARLKISQAKAHLRSFNEEGQKYLSTEPYTLQLTLDEGLVKVEAVITDEPPPALACIIGDFVTNLRAALDYVAWELGTKSPPAPLTDAQEKRITFPLYLSHAGFSKSDSTAKFLENVCGVPTSTMNAIASVQPYQTGYEPLAALDALVRWDKHRTLLLCASFVEHTAATVYYRDKPVFSGHGISFGQRLDPPHSTPLQTNDFRVEVTHKPTIFVVLKDIPAPYTFVGILQDILKCVEGIVSRFDSLV